MDRNFISKNAVDALAAVLKRAATDADFRARCLSNPDAAFEEGAGIDQPASLKIKFVEPKRSEDGLPQSAGTEPRQEPDAFVIELPPFIENADEITDEQLLERIAGGISGNLFCYH